MEKEKDLLEKQLEDDDLLDFDLDDLTEVDFDDESPEEDDIIELVDLVEEGEKTGESAEQELDALLEEEPDLGGDIQELVSDEEKGPSGEEPISMDFSDEAESELDFSLSDIELTEETETSEEFAGLQQEEEESIALEVTELVDDKDLEGLLSEDKLSEEFADEDLEAAIPLESGAGEPGEPEIPADEGTTEIEEPVSDEALSLELAGEDLGVTVQADLEAEEPMEPEAPVEETEELEELLSDKLSPEPSEESFETAGEAPLETEETLETETVIEEKIREIETIPSEEEKPEEPQIEAFQDEVTPEDEIITSVEPPSQEPEPTGQVSPEVMAISEEKIEAIVKNTVEDVLERVAGETLSTVAERVARETMSDVAEKAARETMGEVAERVARETMAEVAERVARETMTDMVERVAREVMAEAAEKAARETMAGVAEKVIGDAIEALKQSLNTVSE